jgi:hypothetical protein
MVLQLRLCLLMLRDERTINKNSPILLFHLVHYIPMSNQEKLNEDTSKMKVRNSQLAAIAKQAKKAGGFQQAFGPLGDILDVGSE